MKTFIRVMKALSDPSRVRIIKLLGARDFCVCELTAILGLAQSTVSKHLKLLEDASLVESWREGIWVNYRLVDHGDNPYAATMQDQLRQWLADDPAIRQTLARANDVDRAALCKLQNTKMGRR